MHSMREYDELIESINQLIRQGDHVFVMINDNDLRGKIHFVFAEDRRVHISEVQEFAQEGDLSLARGTILQMREAVDLNEFDYYINLSDGMMPIKSRTDIVSFLKSNNGKDFYYIDRDEVEDPSLRKKALKYYTFTNLLAFPKGRFTRAFTKGNAAFFNAIGLRRKHKDVYSIGSPWFMLSRDSVIALVKDFDYVSTTYKLSWYPEEMYIQMMMEKFLHQNKNSKQHVNADYRVVGLSGEWVESQGARVLTREVLHAHPDALFGGMITIEDNLDVYQDYFDKYNEDFVKSKETIAKERTFIDPELFITKK